MKTGRLLIPTLTLVVAMTLGFSSAQSSASTKPQALKQKVFAQKLVEQALSEHPELREIELAVQSSVRCSTIAASDPKEIGQKCDHDELEAMRTGKPVVEEEEGFDVTMPLRDVTGKTIGTVGMDFKPTPGQQRSVVVEQARRIVRELETHISSEAKLLERSP